LVNITIKGLTFGYNGSRILDGIDLVVGDAEVLGLVGPNGSGKTTLIKCIDGILKPRGSILLDGREMEAMGRMETAKRLGYVPQSSATPLATSVFDMILMGRRPHMGWRVSSNDLDKVAEVVELLNLDQLATRDFSQISGGQRQKVLMARALCQEPSVLLLDEPTASLDVKQQLEVMETVTSLVREKRISAVMALHDLNLAARFVDKLAILKDGKIYAAGEPADLLNAENIREVYGVEAMVVHSLGWPYIVPMRPLAMERQVFEGAGGL
jgi:iron complex transport system ATP-binding protein